VVFLTRRVAGRELLTDCCAGAARCGVVPGMDVAQARSLLPCGVVLHTEDAQPARDAAALHALACWCLRFSPVVAPDGTDGLLMDVGGMERVYPSEATLVRKVSERLGRMGLSSRVAVASTCACAWAAARFGEQRVTVVGPGTEASVLARLPVDALALDKATVAGLVDVGIETIADLAALPRRSLVSRYGAVVVERLDHALARNVVRETIVGVQAPPEFRAGIMFEGPTDHPESVFAAAQKLLAELAADLARHQRGARRLSITLKRPYAPPTCIDVTLSRPSASVKHLWKLVETRLERVDLGQGVEGVSIAAPRTARLRHEQAGSASMGEDITPTHSAAMGELIDTLVGRLGPDRVRRAVLMQSHLPEHSFRLIPVLEADSLSDGTHRSTPPPAPTSTSYTIPDRPTLLFDKPERADAIALTPDGPVLSLAWRGERHTVITCTSAEHVSAVWWCRGMSVLPDRAYYAAQTDQGRWLFLCRQVGTPNWFVQGEWA
jgi:protein ImuB